MNKNTSFDDLPDLALIQVKSLIDYKVVPYSVTSIWRFVRKGQFPAPIKVSDGITAWRVGDIRKYLLDINNRPQEDSPKVAERKKSVAQSRKIKVSKSGFGEAPIKGEGMATNYDKGMEPSNEPFVKTTWIEFNLPVHLEDECWEMIKQWLKAKGARDD